MVARQGVGEKNAKKKKNEKNEKMHFFACELWKKSVLESLRLPFSDLPF